MDEIQTLLTVRAEEGTCVKIAEKLVELNVGHAAKQNPEDEEA